MFDAPLCFTPLFFPRVWGGRKLHSIYGKELPPGQQIGESWEIVDRAEAQSIVRRGSLHGCSLHHLWVNHRPSIFGRIADAPRFPILVKLLDCRETLSVQVHPPAGVAKKLGGEPKNEWWYVAEAEPEACLYLDVREGTTPSQFADAVKDGRAAECLRCVPTRKGDIFSVPSGRLHAIGAGNLIIEVQQNSDTTYRVFDWNRRDESGRPRELHLEQAMQAIDFSPPRLQSTAAEGTTLVSNSHFQVDQVPFSSLNGVTTSGQFAIVMCLSGSVECGGERFNPGGFFALPASYSKAVIEPLTSTGTLLRITIPSS